MTNTVTDGPRAIVCSRRHGCRSVKLDPRLAADIPPPRVPRTQPSPEWEADRHLHECRYWAAHLNEFVSFLPGIRRRRGDERAGRLFADVLTEIRAAQGEDEAVIARDRLGDVWRWAGRTRP